MALITCPECQKEISDQAELCPHCGFPIRGKKKKKPNTKKAFKTIIITIAALILLVAAGFTVYKFVIAPNNTYTTAVELKNLAQYDEAIIIFEQLGGYKDSVNQIDECNYLKAEEYLNDKEYEEAKIIYSGLGDYSNSSEMVMECDYQQASDLLQNKHYSEASEIFASLGEYSNSQDMAKESIYQMACSMLEGNITKIMESTRIAAYEILASLGDYKDSQELILSKKYECALAWRVDKKYDQAKSLFAQIEEYKDSKRQIALCYIDAAIAIAEKSWCDDLYPLVMEINEKNFGAVDEELSVLYTHVEACYSNRIDSLSSNGYYKEALTYCEQLKEMGLSFNEDSILKKLYGEAKTSLSKKKYTEAKEKFRLLADLDYLDSLDKYNEAVALEKKAKETSAKKKAEAKAAEEALNAEKNRIVGVWIKNPPDSGFELFGNSYLKITSDFTVYFTSDYEIERELVLKGDPWDRFGKCTYDSQTQTFTLEVGRYNYFVTLNGNILTSVAEYPQYASTLLVGTYVRIE